jgi:cytochrome P450
MLSEKDINFLNSPEFYPKSHEIYGRLRSQDPVAQLGLMYGHPVWYITRYEDADAVLRDSQRFALDYRMAFDPGVLESMPDRPQVMNMVNNHLLTREGEDHRRLRSLVSKAFTPARIAGLRPRIQQIADDLIDPMESQGKMDLVESYAFPLPITVIAELLGIPAEDRGKFRGWSNNFVDGAFQEDSTRFFESAMGFVGYLAEAFEKRRQEPGDDLISALLQAEEEGDRLSTEELFSMVVLLIIAGHETTVSLIGNAVVSLLNHPDVLERVKANPAEMPEAVEEVLRLESPVDRSVTRWVTQDTEIGGKQLRRGDMIIAVLGSANRDEGHFDHAAEMNLDRVDKNHLAFGKGVHYCLGAPLARLEGDIALNTLFRRLPGLKLAVPKEKLPFRQTPLFHAFQHIPVEW